MLYQLGPSTFSTARPPRGDICSLGVLLSLLFAGCSAPDPSDSPPPPHRELQEAAHLRDSGQLVQAVIAYEMLLLDGVAEETRYHALLGKAQCRVLAGKNAQGKLDAQLTISFLENDRDIPVRLKRMFISQAESLIGDSAFQSDDVLEARSRYRHALEVLPAGEDDAALRFRLYLAEKSLRMPGADQRIAGLTDLRRREFLDLEARFATTSTNTEAGVAAEDPPPESEFKIISRSYWRARPIRKNKDSMSQISRVTVHHSGTRFSSMDWGSAAQRVRAIQKYHQDENGWADIGYHFIIDPAGRLWEARDISFQGAHAGNWSLNRGNVGICVLGDFRSQKMTVEQSAALDQLLSHLRARYAIPLGQFYTHEEIKKGTTACPGNGPTRALERFRTTYTTRLGS